MDTRLNILCRETPELDPVVPRRIWPVIHANSQVRGYRPQPRKTEDPRFSCYVTRSLTKLHSGVSLTEIPIDGGLQGSAENRVVP
jgi:hypothetical protein